MPILRKSNKKIRKHQEGGPINIYPSYQVQMAQTPQADPTALLKQYAQPAAKAASAEGAAKKAKKEIPNIVGLDSDVHAFMEGKARIENEISEYLSTFGSMDATPEGGVLQRKFDNYLVEYPSKMKNSKETFQTSEASLKENQGAQAWLYDQGKGGYVYDNQEHKYTWISPDLLNTAKVEGTDNYRYGKVTYGKAMEMREQGFGDPSLYFDWGFTKLLGNGLSVNKIFTNVVDDAFKDMGLNVEKKTMTAGNAVIEGADFQKYLDGSGESSNEASIRLAMSTVYSRLSGTNEGAALDGWAWQHSSSKEEHDEKIKRLLANYVASKLKISTETTNERILAAKKDDKTTSKSESEGSSGPLGLSGELNDAPAQITKGYPLSFEIDSVGDYFKAEEEGEQRTSTIVTTQQFQAKEAAARINSNKVLSDQRFSEKDGVAGLGAFTDIELAQGLNGELLKNIEILVNDKKFGSDVYANIMDVAKLETDDFTYVRLPVDPVTGAVLTKDQPELVKLKEDINAVEKRYAESNPIYKSNKKQLEAGTMDAGVFISSEVYKKMKTEQESLMTEYMKTNKPPVYRSFYKGQITYKDSPELPARNTKTKQVSEYFKNYSADSDNPSKYINEFGYSKDDGEGYGNDYGLDLYDDTGDEGKGYVRTTTILIPAGDDIRHQRASENGNHVYTPKQNLTLEALQANKGAEDATVTTGELSVILAALNTI